MTGEKHTVTDDPDDPYDNLEGVIQDIKAGQVNDVDVETLCRVQGQVEALGRNGDPRR
jgi:hypothetical protein